MPTTILYRAMSQQEAEATLAASRPHFIRRWKWFSPNAAWVCGRVQDGHFNNSDAVPDRYTHLLQFKVLDGAEHFQRGCIEWALDRRRLQLVQWGEITLLRRSLFGGAKPGGEPTGPVIPSSDGLLPVL